MVGRSLSSMSLGSSFFWAYPERKRRLDAAMARSVAHPDVRLTHLVREPPGRIFLAGGNCEAMRTGSVNVHAAQVTHAFVATVSPVSNADMFVHIQSMTIEHNIKK